MFGKVLIANRGAIAVRIIRTLKKMGIQSVAIYNEADRYSRHVLNADESYSLGEGMAADTYLNQDKIFEIAKTSGAQAIHPGYGFLSENPVFVERCESSGLAFVGPRAQHMEMFGLKHAARELARDAHVPLLSGSDLLSDLDEAKKFAAQLGYPIILKSTAGGGGIGMQVCADEATLESAFDSVRRLSANNFSNDGVFVEKYIEFARHIEVQVFGDGRGEVITLGERDCSAQRRHQKVIEETPAPNISDKLRTDLQSVAQRLMASVDYRNAGTVEFILDQKTNEFYFLEVNTRLQVEHGVTEYVYGVDLVEWMITLSADESLNLSSLAYRKHAIGHAVQVRIYAEDANKNFQPSAGLLSSVHFPSLSEESGRIDTWVESGSEVSSLFDPMVAKVIRYAPDRNAAISQLLESLNDTVVEGVETNVDYVKNILAGDIFTKGEIYTRYLNAFSYTPLSIDVLRAGTMTTIQDYPGRQGYWDIGVPPSGPFDNYAFRLANKILGNDDTAAGLEVTLNGPILKFNSQTKICLVGADFDSRLDGKPIPDQQVIEVSAGEVLDVGKAVSAGSRCYVAIAGGLQVEPYLGSCSTFTLGQFGGFSGRALRVGDVLHLGVSEFGPKLHHEINRRLMPSFSNDWQLRVIYGPHGAPDFFTDNDIETFFSSQWEVHYNSSRTGIRLIGPKPEWARSDGGEAGMHPSNIHDNAYAIGTVDFTGDMPVILGPDGPSLGGFVCPATVITADLWKLGQLKAGDKIEFIPVSLETANALESSQLDAIENLDVFAQSYAREDIKTSSPILDKLPETDSRPEVVYRPSGDKYLLVEYGAQELDIRLRFRAHALMLKIQARGLNGVLELTPGIRSLQVYYDSQILLTFELLNCLKSLEDELTDIENIEVPSRIVHLPLSWDDEACWLAIEKYMQSVRSDAPWCPSNIEFIRRINGLDSIDDVKKILFDASYVVMGLGDVYLGAPVATPLDPRHRLVTTKYNPARTWTAENSVGIGGSYLCIYGMEGPGGYQFVGRTLQMWNRYKKTDEFTQPWLLRFFDQIRFYEVSAEELVQIRKDFPHGNYPLKIEESSFCLKDYQAFLESEADSIDHFTEKRNKAFDEELQRWIESGQINFESEGDINTSGDQDEQYDPASLVESPVSGSVWKMMVREGDEVKSGDLICVLESMKMEIEVHSNSDGLIKKILRAEGQQLQAGQAIVVLNDEEKER